MTEREQPAGLTAFSMDERARVLAIAVRHPEGDLLTRLLAVEAQLRADLERAREERDVYLKSVWREAEALGACRRERAAARAELARAVLAEREACCAILASAEPNTRAEQVIARIDADPRRHRLPSWLDRALAEWCAATADELRDLRQQMQARGVDDAIRDALNAPVSAPGQVRDRHFDADGSTLAAPPPAARPERGGECDNHDGATGTRCNREDGHGGYCDFGPRLPEPGHCEPAPPAASAGEVTHEQALDAFCRAKGTSRDHAHESWGVLHSWLCQQAALDAENKRVAEALRTRDLGEDLAAATLEEDSMHKEKP